MSEEENVAPEAASDAPVSSEPDTSVPDTPKGPTLEDAISSAYDKIDEKENLNTDQEVKPKSETPGDEAKAESTAIEAPKFWSADKKEIFATLPRPAQEAILEEQRNADKITTQKFQKIAEKDKEYTYLDTKIPDVVKEAFTKGETNRTQYIENLIAADNEARRDPLSLALKIIAGSGATLDQFLQRAQAESSKTPEMRELESKAQLYEQLSSERDAELQKQKESRDRADAESFLEDFSQRKDEAGNLLYPKLNEIQEKVAKEFNEVLARNPGAPVDQVLERAYQIAWVNSPDYQKALIDERARAIADEILAKQQEENRSKVEKAKKAAVSFRGSSQSANGINKPSSLDEALSRAYDKAASGL